MMAAVDVAVDGTPGVRGHEAQKRLYDAGLNLKSTGDALAKMGHKVYWWSDWTWLAGAPCTIVVDHKTGVRQGGADPRRPAYALGW